jgi:N-acetylglucosamine-6-sulfatase
MSHHPGRKASRGSLACAAAALSFAALVAAPAAAAAASPPNIVMIIADDLDTSVWNTALSLGYLPQIQARMIGKGTTFNNTFAALAVCCPSRVTYLTGQYSHNHGVIRNGGPQGGFESFTSDDNTLAVWLQKAGYRTGLIGKYLNNYGLDNGRIYVPPGWDTWQALPGLRQFNYNMYDNNNVRRFGALPDDYQTDVVARLVQQFIRNPDARPFFLTVTPTAPHYEGDSDDSGPTITPAPRHADTPPISPIPPESARAYNEANMKDKPAWMRDLPPADTQLMRSGYNSKVAAMRAFDDLVGGVFQALQDIDAAAKTLVIITSDNGYQYGTHRRTAKTDLYEESIRLPMVISAPGQTQARVTDEWVMNTDWAATIVDYAGVKPRRELDGRSLRGLIDGAAGATGRRSILVEHPSDGRNSGNPPYAMIRSKNAALTLDDSSRKALVYAQTLDSKGTLITDEELYDLDEDPDQLKSLHKSRDATRLTQKNNLANRLVQLKSCSGAACRALED